jgi:hypothetical protein
MSAAVDTPVTAKATIRQIKFLKRIICFSSSLLAAKFTKLDSYLSYVLFFTAFPFFLSAILSP